MAKVQMKATAMGTVSGSRGILHTDPQDGADRAARFPLVDEDDAATLERLGYAKRHDGKVDGDDAGDEPGLPIGERAGVMVEENVDAENSVEATTGLSTRDTTAFEAPIESLSAAAGRTLTVDDGVADASEETAPAGRGRGRAAKPAE